MTLQSDPFAALENIAKRQAAEEAAGKALTKARVKLVLGKDAKSVFFASLALRLDPVIDWNIDTAATDGKRLCFNPDFIGTLDTPQLVGLVAHEVMHNALSHHTRRGERDPQRWNIACDWAVNKALKEADYTLPPGGLMPGDLPGGGKVQGVPLDGSAESYYPLVPEEAGGSGQGDDPGRCGGVKDAGDPAACKSAEADAQVAVAQAAENAKGRGELPGGLSRMVGDVVNPTVPWQDVLREFVSRSIIAKDDYSWSVPNRRYIAQGIYLPSLRSEGMGHVVIAVDTSGSIDETTLEKFGSEVNGILECSPCKVSVVYCDAQVQRVDEWSPCDGPLVLDAPGGGGTSHEPIWDWLKDADDPACVVCLTDGCTAFGKDPGVPVLWALTEDAKPPFGRSLMIA